MKKLLSLIVALSLVVMLSACDSYAENTSVGSIDVDTLAAEVAAVINEGREPEVIEVAAECESTESTGSSTLQPVIPIIHINGEGHEAEEEVYVLFEYKTLKYTKYQISYLSCTCRPADINYRQVMYIELNNRDGAVKYISFGADSTSTEEHMYTPGTWGDSSPIPLAPNKTLEDFQTEMIDGYLVGKTPADLADMYTLTDMTDWELADTYVGNSVSTNNLLRAVKAIQEYHMSNQ